MAESDFRTQACFLFQDSDHGSIPHLVFTSSFSLSMNGNTLVFVYTYFNGGGKKNLSGTLKDPLLCSRNKLAIFICFCYRIFYFCFSPRVIFLKKCKQYQLLCNIFLFTRIPPNAINFNLLKMHETQVIGHIRNESVETIFPLIFMVYKQMCE